MRSVFVAATIVTWTFCAIVSSAASHAQGQPVPPGARVAIESTLDCLEQAVSARDMERLLANFAPDSLLLRDMRARYEAYFGLDSLTCVERLSAITMHGDTARAVVSEEIRASEHDRVQADYSWRTRDFVAGPTGWQIVADRECRYSEGRFTDLVMELFPAEHRLDARARLVVGVKPEGADNVVLQLNRGLEVHSIEDAEGTTLPFTRRAEFIVVPLPHTESDSLELTLDYAGELFNEAREQGYSQVGIGPEGSFASWVTDWYPRVRGESSKSRGRLCYVVPKGVTVASSGRPISAVEEGERSRQTFEVRTPLDFSFAAANYFHRSENVNGIEVGVFFLQGGDAKAGLYIESCSRILGFLQKLYGFYPFDSYAVVELPSDAVGTLGGSSEQGMNLFPAGGLPDTEFPLPLLGHEIGHSWWGNWVSGKGAILDEGLAQMTAVLCVQEIAGEASMRRFLRRGFPAYRQSAEMYFRRFGDGPERDLPLSALAAGSDQAAALHDLADVKGFFAYQMLREEIGDDAFLGGLRAALAIYGRREMTLGDLRRLWEKSSGRDLGWFFEQWFERRGAPELTLEYVVTPTMGGRYEVAGRVKQVGEVYRVRLEVVAARAGQAAKTEILDSRGAETPFRFVTDARPDSLLLDPAYKILRWTDDFRLQGLLSRARSFHNIGEAGSAEAVLNDYLVRAPRSQRGRADRALWHLQAGRLELAKHELQALRDRLSVWPIDDPVAGRCELGLGMIADLEGRRDDALAHYRRALEQSDDPTTQEEAARYLALPHRAQDDDMSVDPALAARCVGTYKGEPGLSVTVTNGKAGRLKVTTSRGQIFGLKHAQGTTFSAIGESGWSFEFGFRSRSSGGASSNETSTGTRSADTGEGAFNALTLNRQGRLFRLERAD